MIESHSLPSTWARVRLEDISEVILGQSPPGSSYNTDGIGVPLFQGSAEFGDLYPSVRKWTTEPTKLAKAGDVLLSVRAPVGPTNLAPLDCAIGRGVAAIRAADGIEPRYLLYGLRATESMLSSKGTGTTFTAVSGAVVRAHSIPLAPAAEQRRIVAAIEGQFSRIDAAVEALQRARRNLQQMQDSIVRLALEGRLVGAQTNDGSADTLLKRILDVRHRSWQTAHPQYPSKYTDPEMPAVGRTVRTLRNGWTWASLEQLTDGARKIAYGVLQPGHHVESGVPLIRVGDVNGGVVTSTQALKRIDPKIAMKYPRTRLIGGEVVLTLVGSIGRSAIVPIDLAGGNVARAIALIPLTFFVDAQYISLCLNDRLAGTELTDLAHEVARKTLNLEDVKRFPIPLPPLAEQRQIVDRVASYDSAIRATQKSIERALKRADFLKIAVLNSAFSGGLVPQEPSDEPAETLPVRIKAAGTAKRGALPEAKPKRRRR